MQNSKTARLSQQPVHVTFVENPYSNEFLDDAQTAVTSNRTAHCKSQSLSQQSKSLSPRVYQKREYNAPVSHGQLTRQSQDQKDLVQIPFDNSHESSQYTSYSSNEKHRVRKRDIMQKFFQQQQKYVNRVVLQRVQQQVNKINNCFEQDIANGIRQFHTLTFIEKTPKQLHTHSPKRLSQPSTLDTHIEKHQLQRKILDATRQKEGLEQQLVKLDQDISNFSLQQEAVHKQQQIVKNKQFTAVQSAAENSGLNDQQRLEIELKLDEDAKQLVLRLKREKKQVEKVRRAVEQQKQQRDAQLRELNAQRAAELREQQEREKRERQSITLTTANVELIQKRQEKRQQEDQQIQTDKQQPGERLYQRLQKQHLEEEARARQELERRIQEIKQKVPSSLKDMHLTQHEQLFLERLKAREEELRRKRFESIQLLKERVPSPKIEYKNEQWIAAVEAGENQRKQHSERQKLEARRNYGEGVRHFAESVLLPLSLANAEKSRLETRISERDDTNSESTSTGKAFERAGSKANLQPPTSNRNNNSNNNNNNNKRLIRLHRVQSQKTMANNSSASSGSQLSRQLVLQKYEEEAKSQKRIRENGLSYLKHAKEQARARVARSEDNIPSEENATNVLPKDGGPSNSVTKTHLNSNHQNYSQSGHSSSDRLPSIESASKFDYLAEIRSRGNAERRKKAMWQRCFTDTEQDPVEKYVYLRKVADQVASEAARQESLLRAGRRSRYHLTVQEVTEREKIDQLYYDSVKAKLAMLTVNAKLVTNGEVEFPLDSRNIVLTQ